MGVLRKLINALKSQFGLDLEKSLINLKFDSRIDASKVGGIHIKTGKNSTVNVNIVAADPTALHDLLGKENFDLAELIRERPDLLVGATREDLLENDSYAFDSIDKGKHLLIRLKSIIPQDDVIALSIAISIYRFENGNEPMKAMNLKNHLVDKYGERGKRIYNFFASGMMEEILIPAVNWLDYVATASDVIHIKELWNACLQEMDYAIYVNSIMTPEEIVNRLRKKFRSEGVPVNYLFGRTLPIIEKIRFACQEFLKLEYEHQIEKIEYEACEKVYRVGDCETIILEIRIKK